MQRRLAAILAADVVGYSRLMEASEADTLVRLKSTRARLIDPEIALHNGRVVKLMGDGTLIEFGSVVDAVRCAVEIQRKLAIQNADLPEDRRLEFRIGVNLGDIIVDDQDIYGDGVNVAARLEGLAEPGGVLISGSAFDQVERKLDYVFEFIGEQTVKNIERPVRLYRVTTGMPAKMPATGAGRRKPFVTGLVAALIVLAVGGAALWNIYWSKPVPAVDVASKAKMAFPLPDKPSIAVLPFTNMSDAPGQEDFADGMTDDLITDLSKISGLFVISRNSTFVYKGRAVKISQVSEDLGVHYVLEGSVQRAGDQLRVNAQLIDALSGGHVWADRYDGSTADLFAVQDSFVHKIVDALKVTLKGTEEQQIASAQTDNMRAKQAFDEGWKLYLRYTPEDTAAAMIAFKKAVELDPEYGRAYAALALAGFRVFDSLWFKKLGIDPYENWYGFLQYIELAKKYPTSLSYTVAALRDGYQGMGAEARRDAGKAIAADPNDPEAHIAMAWALTISGEPAEALNFIAAAIRLNPNYPSHYVLARGSALYAEGDLQQAADVFEDGVKRNPQAAALYVPLSSVLAQLGHRSEAREMLFKYWPGISQQGLDNFADIYTFPFQWDEQHAAVRERLYDGLRLAALPLDVTVPSLVAQLQSNQPFAQLLAAKRLGYFGAAAASAVPTLVETLNDEFLRQEAVITLGKIGPEAKAAIPALTGLEGQVPIGSYASQALRQITGN